MRKHITLPAIFMAFTILQGCLPVKNYKNPKGEERSCDDYYSYVKENWRKNADGVFEFAKLPGYDSTLAVPYQYINKPCLLGLNRKQITKLFGEPSGKAETEFIENPEFQYFTRKECFQEGKIKVGCARLMFMFDKNGKVDKIVLPTVETPPLLQQKN